MTHEILIAAPNAESAAEIVNRLHPGATIRAMTEAGPANPADVAEFHAWAKNAYAPLARQNQRRRNRYDPLM